MRLCAPANVGEDRPKERMRQSMSRHIIPLSKPKVKNYFPKETIFFSKILQFSLPPLRTFSIHTEGTHIHIHYTYTHGIRTACTYTRHTQRKARHHAVSGAFVPPLFSCLTSPTAQPIAPAPGSQARSGPADPESHLKPRRRSDELMPGREKMPFPSPLPAHRPP